MNKARWLIPLLAVAAVVMYLTLTETRRYPVHLTPDSQVQRQPYHAAQALLAQWGQPSRQILSSASLFPLPENTTVIVEGHRLPFNAVQREQLLDWVDNGGNLIIAQHRATQGYTDSSDSPPLWQALGITLHQRAHFQELDEPLTLLLDELGPMADRLFEYCLYSDSDELREQCQRLACEAPRQAPVARWDEPGPLQGRRLQLAQYQYLEWSDSNERPLRYRGSAQHRHGAQLIQLELGAGQIHVLTGLWHWDNSHLHYFDHAWWLQTLTQGQPVWWVRRLAVPSFPQWLWQQAAPLISALLILLLLWLWWRAPRRGPLWQAGQHRSRDFLAHLQASGHFLYRTGNYQALLGGLREQVEQQLLATGTARQTALARAAEQLQIPQSLLEQALAKEPDSAEHLTEMVRLLQQLRKCV